MYMIYNKYFESPWVARLVLIGMMLLLGYGVYLDVSLGDDPARSNAAETGDVALYRVITERVRAGEDYYNVVGDEQHRRGYPTQPFLTWRLPTAAWIISWLGENGAANLLRVLAVLTILAWILDLKQSGMSRMAVVAGALMVYSGLMVVLTLPALYLHESWAATLMTLSLPLQSRWWRLSVVCGIAALAFRELALPFALVMASCALLEGRWREAGWWVAGMVAFFIALALHAWMVEAHISPEAGQGGGWLALGGWGFVLTVNLWNVLIISAPSWVIALWMPLALVGATVRQDPLGLRLMLIVWGYTLAFLFVGRDNNHYWGIIYGPLVAVSLTFAPAALGALWSAAVGNPARTA